MRHASGSFKESIESVLSAKEAQGAIRMQREIDQGSLRQEKAADKRQQDERFGKGPQRDNPPIIRHVRNGRSERTLKMTRGTQSLARDRYRELVIKNVRAHEKHEPQSARPM